MGSVTSLHEGLGKDRAVSSVNTLADCDRCAGHRFQSRVILIPTQAVDGGAHTHTHTGDLCKDINSASKCLSRLFG